MSYNCVVSSHKSVVTLYITSFTTNCHCVLATISRLAREAKYSNRGDLDILYIPSGDEVLESDAALKEQLKRNGQDFIDRAMNNNVKDPSPEATNNAVPSSVTPAS